MKQDMEKRSSTNPWDENATVLEQKPKLVNTKFRYWSDRNYQSNLGMMVRRFHQSNQCKSQFRGKLVFPKDGLGTGLAELKTKAPQTYDWFKE